MSVANRFYTLDGWSWPGAAPAKPPINNQEFQRMPTPTWTSQLTPDDSNPVGTDFIGGAEALPAKPAAQGQNVPGSDFAGGTLPLTARAGQGEIDKDRAA
jgi:hypothetical protein